MYEQKHSNTSCCGGPNRAADIGVQNQLVPLLIDHTLSAPALHASDYHMINLLRMNRAGKDTAKVEGRPSDNCSGMRLGLLNQRPC